MDTKYENYISEISKDFTKLAKLKYLLIYEKEKDLNYIEGADLDIIADEYELEELNANEALDIALKKLSSSNGAIYELKEKKYKLLVRKSKNGK